MKYILLIYGDEKVWESASQQEAEKIHMGHRVYGENIGEGRSDTRRRRTEVYNHCYQHWFFTTVGPPPRPTVRPKPKEQLGGYCGT